MGLIRNIVVLVLAVSFLTFVAFFGRLPAFRNTPIGALHRVLWIHIPKGLGRVDRIVTGGRLVPSITRAGNYVLYQKHPIVLFIFLGLLTGSVGLFVPQTWPHLSPVQKLFTLLVAPPPYIFTYICQISKPDSPHLITPFSITTRLKDYPYDHVLYHPNNICKTCALPKPARSKHCSLCNACVARCDHHCVWINNCVGRGNYKYFLGLLLFTTFTLAYGTYLTWSTLMPEIRWHFEHHPDWYLSEPSGRTDFIGRVLDKFIYGLDVFSTGLLIGGLGRAGVGLLAAMTWPLPLGLLSYHIYLIWAGMTTNETAKWSDWREDMVDGLVFAAELKKPEFDSGGELDGAAGSRRDGIEWPHRSKVFLVRTSDGQSPRFTPNEIKELVVEDTWKEVWHLKDVENIYDLGFWGNLREALVN